MPPKSSVKPTGKARRANAPSAKALKPAAPTRPEPQSTTSTKRAAISKPEDEPEPKRQNAQPAPASSTGQKTGQPFRLEPPRKVLDVFMFGSGACGELGLGVKKTEKKKDPTLARYPTRNPLLGSKSVGIVQIAVGGMHSVALARDRRVFTWGVNDNNAVGRDTKWEEPAEGLPDDVADLNPLESTPAPVTFPAVGTDPVCIVQVAACDSATFALTDDGHVYGWGCFRASDGLFGFLYDSIKDKAKAQESEKSQATPALIPGLTRVKELSCGANHVLALTDSGNVLAWGVGEQSELGRRILPRRRYSCLIPAPVRLPKNKVERIYAGFHHNFAVDQGGRIHAWGLNNFGQTGIPADDDQLTVPGPTVVESLGDSRIAHMSGGSHHSLACTEDGQVLAWGRCDDCQMGVSLDDIPRDHLKFDSAGGPRILNTPTAVRDINATFVAAGIDNSMAISKDGRLYAWGFSSEYRTGLGTDDSVEKPTVAKRGDASAQPLSFVGSRGQFSAAAGPAAGQ